MPFQKICEPLTVLNEKEQIGYEYYSRTGKYLDEVSLAFLAGSDSPYDFERLKTKQFFHFAEEYADSVSEANSKSIRLKRIPRYTDIPLHAHGHFELVCVIQGSCTHTVNDCEFKMEAGDITITPPKIKRRLSLEPDCIAIGAAISPDTFESLFSPLIKSGSMLSAYFSNTLYSKHRSTVTFRCGSDEFLPELLIYALEQQDNESSHFDFISSGLMITMFSYLIQKFESTVELFQNDNALGQRMIAVENYIRQNYKTATLVSTAEHFYLTPAYMSGKIKEQTGYTFTQILSHIRLGHAEELLLSTKMNLDRICESVGYSDTTHFIKSFKKIYGMTPNKYRMKQK